MAHTTFLLGAGASIGCLPVVTQINNRIEYYLSNYLNDLDRKFGSVTIPDSYGDSVSNLIYRFANDLTWLSGELQSSATFDTLAKTYLIQNRPKDLEKLKFIISVLFLLEQGRNAPDVRYGLFWASIIRQHFSELEANKRINILSWNYDSQLEKTLLPLASLSKISALTQSLQILPNEDLQQDFDFTRFSIIKLNGSAGMYLTEQESLQRTDDLITLQMGPQFFQGLYSLYGEYKNPPRRIKPQINFAWEENKLSKRMIELATKASMNSTNLVVIGYSFPFFNREVDAQIFTKMGNLRHIYIQVSPEDAGGVETRIGSFVRDFVKIHRISDLSQFYLPFPI